jgi:hypothetical protein
LFLLFLVVVEAIPVPTARTMGNCSAALLGIFPLGEESMVRCERGVEGRAEGLSVLGELRFSFVPVVETIRRFFGHPQ